MFFIKSWKSAVRNLIINQTYMEKKLLFLAAGLMMLFTACNNSADTSHGNAVVKTKADTLFDEVMDGHNIGMGKMGKLTRAEQEVGRILDSIGKLPSKARQAAEPYKAKLESLLNDLKQADFSMNKWMDEFKIDSAAQNVEERIKYLFSEKVKVTGVKESILNSLQKADSLLKRKI
jgi:hypothetical protein